MSRDSLLDDAIASAKASKDLQLAEWLRAARGAESAARWYSEKLRDAYRANRKLLDKNAKLCELVRDLYLQLLNAYDPKELDEFEDRMCKLGVGVYDG